MYNSNIPKDRHLPSTSMLIKSTVVAMLTAMALLITVVMPAEYGVDPTGIGNAIGLKKMGEIKMSLAKEAVEEEKIKAIAVEAEKPVAQTVIAPPPAPATKMINGRTDEMQVTLTPNEGTEIKVTMKKGGKVDYHWSTNGGRANFDVHGDSKELNINYHGYGKGSEQQSEGTLEAAFDGHHGWFWRNRTSETITITLKISGEYTAIKKMD